MQSRLYREMEANAYRLIICYNQIRYFLWSWRQDIINNLIYEWIIYTYIYVYVGCPLLLDRMWRKTCIQFRLLRARDHFAFSLRVIVDFRPWNSRKIPRAGRALLMLSLFTRKYRWKGVSVIFISVNIVLSLLSQYNWRKPINIQSKSSRLWRVMARYWGWETLEVL